MLEADEGYDGNGDGDDDGGSDGDGVLQVRAATSFSLFLTL